MKIKHATECICAWAVYGTVICAGLCGFEGRVSADPTVLITGDVSTEFGIYHPVVVEVTPSVTPYEIEPDLANVTIGFPDYVLTGEARARIADQGFIALASPYRQLYDIYNLCEACGWPAFVTTDACLHSYHILYDYILRVLEVNYFIDDIDGLTRTLRSSSQTLYENTTDETVRQALQRITDYFSVAYGLLNPEASDYSAVAAEEVGMIMEGSPGYVQSPMFYSEDYPYEEDYSQYKPRGHYTRSVALEQYFLSMMWYGRITFSLNLLHATQEGLREAAREALLISRMLRTETVGDAPAAAVWDRIYSPTVFFVGKSDDITFDGYLGIAREVYGEDFLSQPADVLADDTLIDAFIARALELPDPKITVKAGKGLRLMGQRFIPDSYILDQLVFEFVLDRLMPRGLDVMAVLGSARAYEIIDTFYHDPDIYPDYPVQVAKLRAEFAGYAPEIWAQNLYFNWLYALLPLLEVKGEGYPPFMQSEAWVDKNLNSALGSWAELRHDTILYAKQSETGETSEPSQPPFIRGYVEPEPEVYARLAALAGFMRRGLEDRGLLDSLYESRLAEYETLMLSLMDIAVKELQNIAPTPAEYALIANFGGTIEALTSFPPEVAGQYQNDADDFMAVIADIHTDPNTNSALEVGVGHPLYLFVAAPVNGVLTLTLGSIFSYHEFTQPLAEGRLTDEEWQALQSGPDAVSMPEWILSFLEGDSSLKQDTYHVHPNPGTVVGVEEDRQEAFVSITCNPNPFNTATTIQYRLPESVAVKLIVYNVSGQAVEVLADGWFEKGIHTVTWTPQACASGIYIVRLISGSGSGAVKLLYMK